MGTASTPVRVTTARATPRLAALAAGASPTPRVTGPRRRHAATADRGPGETRAGARASTRRGARPRTRHRDDVARSPRSPARGDVEASGEARGDIEAIATRGSRCASRRAGRDPAGGERASASGLRASHAAASSSLFPSLLAARIKRQIKSTTRLDFDRGSTEFGLRSGVEYLRFSRMLRGCDSCFGSDWSKPPISHSIRSRRLRQQPRATLISSLKARVGQNGFTPRGRARGRQRARRAAPSASRRRSACAFVPYGGMGCSRRTRPSRETCPRGTGARSRARRTPRAPLARSPRERRLGATRASGRARSSVTSAWTSPPTRWSRSADTCTAGRAFTSTCGEPDPPDPHACGVTRLTVHQPRNIFWCRHLRPTERFGERARRDRAGRGRPRRGALGRLRTPLTDRRHPAPSRPRALAHAPRTPRRCARSSRNNPHAGG